MLKRQFAFGVLSGVVLTLIAAGSFFAYKFNRFNASRSDVSLNGTDFILDKRRDDIVSSLLVLKKSAIQSLPNEERIFGAMCFDGLEKTRAHLTKNDVGDLEKGYLMSEEMRLGDSKTENERAARFLIYAIDMVQNRHAR